MIPPIRIYVVDDCPDCRRVEEIALSLGLVKHKDFVIRPMAWLTRTIDVGMDWRALRLQDDLSVWAFGGSQSAAPFVVIKASSSVRLDGYSGLHDAESGIRAFCKVRDVVEDR